MHGGLCLDYTVGKAGAFRYVYGRFWVEVMFRPDWVSSEDISEARNG